MAPNSLLLDIVIRHFLAHVGKFENSDVREKSAHNAAVPYFHIIQLADARKQSFDDTQLDTHENKF